MDKKDYKINIIGAGLSGLVAAKVLENHGYHPEIYEAGDAVGGRIRTDIVKRYRLDRGFQVLLSEYPKAKQYLNLDKLDLKKLKPGAVIFREGRKRKIGDPLRDSSFLLTSIFSGVGSLNDKLKILKLYLELRKLDPEAIFNEPEITTMKYLQQKGFSENIIQNFFKPFFSGIFLEPDLKTSSRMFRFVFKMFGEGEAVIPALGMGEICKQLAEDLSVTKIHYNSKVKQVTDTQLILESGSEVSSHFSIIASEASPLVSNLRNQKMTWKSCHCFYFTAKQAGIEGRIIGLIADEEAIINNIFYHTSLEETETDQHLISVTIVKDTKMGISELEARVREELKKYCHIEVDEMLQHYKIKKALPDIDMLQYGLMPTETRLNNRVFLAGDQLLNGSQNAAMLSGERAALGLIETLEGGAITAEITSEYR
ncbi:FAD-dependent oxidoreductase [Christiangramia sabulilitoris]|uniref:FAD-dependent oxidoreductase n=1 Tax=Christiangramia sabulilitoris TaxID=2583991 RepID=A0A550I7B0_9FLAO|nr:FAD-dependent oxidoreductase [Christiangramia sabulilitoris]TRO66841.1 FAD-dependent oxidoreductase [Christiangramia sabulilitoris]